MIMMKSMLIGMKVVVNYNSRGVVSTVYLLFIYLVLIVIIIYLLYLHFCCVR